MTPRIPGEPDDDILGEVSFDSLPDLGDEGPPLARSASTRADPVILALLGDKNAAALVEALEVGSLMEGLHFKPVKDEAALLGALRRDPTMAILIEDAAHFGMVASLKADRALRDVPVLFVNDESSSEALTEAIEAGCDDVAPIDRGLEPLTERLNAIWRYHRKYGFSPPSGHWFALASSDSADERYAVSDEELTLHGTNRFIGGQDGSAHLMLISNHPYYRLGGQELLSRAGYHVSFSDTGWLGLKFLHDLAGHHAESIPDFLQGKLDLVIIAQGASTANSLQLVRQIKETPHFSAVPVLLILDNDDHLAMVSPYRSKGVFTMINPQPQPEELAFRIYEIFQHLHQPGHRDIHRHRHTVRCEYRLLGEGDEPGAWQPALTYNLSRSSAYVRTIEPPARKSRVELRFRLRRFGILLEFEGPVVWSTPWMPVSQRPYPAGFGVSLHKGSQSDFEALTDFCDFLAES